MILRRFARPMLAAVFVSGGIQTLRNPKPPIEAVEPMIDKAVGQMRDRLPDQVPTDAESLVKLDAMIKIGAGLALAFNRFPRLASFLLAGTLVPTTVATHRFWEHEDPLERSEQQTHFLKNIGLLGGLLIASADTHGKPSLNWHARHAARVASGKLDRTTGKVQGHVQHAAGAVQGTVHSATGAVQGTLQSAAGAVQETAQSAAGAVKKPVRQVKSLLPG
jgi:putative oxidoreductase